jgi:hypothetical protein
MSIGLENSFLKLRVEPDRGAWSLAGKREKDLALDEIRTALYFRKGRGAIRRALDRWASLEAAGPETIPSPHGPLQQIHLTFGMNPASWAAP